jgi:serine/threonine protein kinase
MELQSFKEHELARVLQQVSAGLAALHSHGFAHLDIKPDNILIGQDDAYKIADFGLAVQEPACRDDVSDGDCRYLAMEVLRGDHSALHKADIFSLGIVGYEMATTPQPLAPNGEVWRRLREEPLALVHCGALPSLTEPLLALLRAMLLPSTAERIESKLVGAHSALASPEHQEAREAALEEQLREARREAEALKALLASGASPCSRDPSTPRKLPRSSQLCTGRLGG